MRGYEQTLVRAFVYLPLRAQDVQTTLQGWLESGVIVKNLNGGLINPTRKQTQPLLRVYE